MENLAKPRLAEVLGVEEDKTWSYPGCFGLYRIHSGVREYWDDNNGWLACDCEEDLIKIIAQPEAIIRTSFLTKPELAICKAVGAKWVSRGALGIKSVVLWDEKPECFDDGTFGSTDTAHKLARIYTRFESIHPGDLIPVNLEK